jgi:hypothetical protein
MNGMFVCTCVTYFFFTDLRPEPAIITTEYASFSCAGDNLSATISASYRLGNDFHYFY